MATCPRCRGHLTENHRCLRTSAAAQISAPALAGGLLALLVVSLVDPGDELTYIGPTAVTIGVFGGIGLDRLLRG